MRLTAQEVYDKLINEDDVFSLQGQIRFSFGGVDIIVKQKDVVGNIIQEWLQRWFDKRGIEYALNNNTQMPPDFYLNPRNKKTGLLEVKAFNRERTPGFDISDFRKYKDEIINSPFMLNADYLIFGYKMRDNGTVVIKDVWLKKVWEISSSSEKWPLKLQVKQRQPYNIRPGVWYGRPKYPMFKRKEDFICALDQSVQQKYQDKTWLKRFLDAYENICGKRLVIPKWSDIEEQYR